MNDYDPNQSNNLNESLGSEKPFDSGEMLGLNKPLESSVPENTKPIGVEPMGVAPMGVEPMDSGQSRDFSPQGINRDEGGYTPAGYTPVQPYDSSQPYSPPPVVRTSGRNTSVIGIVILIIAVAAAVYFKPLSLFEKEKTFTSNGLSITLTSKYVKKDIMTFTDYYQSNDSIVGVIKEDFELIREIKSIFNDSEISENMSLKKYAQVINKANNTNYAIKEKNGLTYFEFEKSMSGRSFTFYAVVFRGSDAYWLVQFSCENKNYKSFLPKFEKWAQSVVV